MGKLATALIIGGSLFLAYAIFVTIGQSGQTTEFAEERPGLLVGHLTFLGLTAIPLAIGILLKTGVAKWDAKK